MENVKIEGDIVTITKETVEIIDLLPLKEELSSLKSIVKPENEVVMTMALKGEIHPYYHEATQARIDYLEMEINKWQSK